MLGKLLLTKLVWNQRYASWQKKYEKKCPPMFNIEAKTEDRRNLKVIIIGATPHGEPWDPLEFVVILYYLGWLSTICYTECSDVLWHFILPS